MRPIAASSRRGRGLPGARRGSPAARARTVPYAPRHRSGKAWPKARTLADPRPILVRSDKDAHSSAASESRTRARGVVIDSTTWRRPQSRRPSAGKCPRAGSTSALCDYRRASTGITERLVLGPVFRGAAAAVSPCRPSRSLRAGFCGSGGASSRRRCSAFVPAVAPALGSQEQRRSSSQSTRCTK